MMYTCAERLYGAEDYLHRVPQNTIDVCMEQCTLKKNLPCDETVYDLCNLLMDECGRQHADSGEKAVLDYQFLREITKREIS